MSTPSQQVIVTDEFYQFNPDTEIQKERRKFLDAKDPRYFNKCMINVTAAAKMLKHSIQGVVDGKAKTGMSVEVMGLLVGRPMGNQVIITDVVQLPIEGMENRIEAGEEVQVFMVQMSELLKLKREERFVGWYHSHPFELLPYSHCHLSNTDIGTQARFQMTTQWWTALVIDPIRSIAEKKFEIGAYCVYPNGASQPDGLAPDMTKWANAAHMKRRWGASPSRYYTLEMTYWMSQNAAKFSNRTGAYTNWTKPLLTSVFTDFLKYQQDLAIVNESLTMLGAHLDPNIDPEDYLPEDTTVTPNVIQALVSDHVEECRCGKNGHSKMLQLAFGAILSAMEGGEGSGGSVVDAGTENSGAMVVEQ